MKRAPRSRQRHDLYAKYHDYDSEISDLLGECGVTAQSFAANMYADTTEDGRYYYRITSSGQMTVYDMRNFSVKLRVNVGLPIRNNYPKPYFPKINSRYVVCHFINPNIECRIFETKTKREIWRTPKAKSYIINDYFIKQEVDLENNKRRIIIRDYDGNVRFDEISDY